MHCGMIASSRLRSLVAPLLVVAALGITAVNPADAASDFTVNQVPPDSLLGQWTTVPDAVQYGFYVVETGQSNGTFLWCTSCTSQTMSGLKPGRSYSAAAVAVTPSGWTQRGATQTVLIPATAPNAPSTAVAF